MKTLPDETNVSHINILQIIFMHNLGGGYLDFLNSGGGGDNSEN